MAFQKKQQRPMKKKTCSFCEENGEKLSYKDVNKLRRFISERGKILPRRITGDQKSKACGPVAVY